MNRPTRPGDYGILSSGEEFDMNVETKTDAAQNLEAKSRKLFPVAEVLFCAFVLWVVAIVPLGHLLVSRFDRTDVSCGSAVEPAPTMLQRTDGADVDRGRALTCG
jgi:hypothetical protein